MVIIIPHTVVWADGAVGVGAGLVVDVVLRLPGRACALTRDVEVEAVSDAGAARPDGETQVGRLPAELPRERAHRVFSWKKNSKRIFQFNFIGSGLRQSRKNIQLSQSYE